MSGGAWVYKEARGYAAQTKGKVFLTGQRRTCHSNGAVNTGNVLNHLILEGKELESLHVGNKVRLVIEKSNTIFNRNNEEGFRDARDKIDVFYIGEKPKLLAPNCDTCEPRD